MHKISNGENAMTMEALAIPQRCSVLSMDMQAGIVSIYAGNDDGLITRAAATLVRCRDLGMKVIHVQVGFRPGLPEVSAHRCETRRKSPEVIRLRTGYAPQPSSASTPT